MTTPKVNWLDLDSTETSDPHFTEAKQAIRKYVEKQDCTVGALRRKFPEFVHIIWDCLHDLKLEGKIDFSESSPAPTRITAKSMRRVNSLRYRSSSVHREKASEVPFDLLDTTI